MKDFNTLVDEMKPYILSIIKKLNIYRDHEEYFQVGLIGLWDACRYYQPEKGTFKTYAYHCIYSQILRKLRKEMKKNQYEKYFDFQVEKVDEQNHSEEVQTCLLLKDQ